MSRISKAGRKPRHYVTADKRTIDGLYRKPGTNRYRVTLAGSKNCGKSFNAPDEASALHRFRQLTADASSLILMRTTTGEQHGSKLANTLAALQRQDNAQRQQYNGEGEIHAVESSDMIATFKDWLLNRTAWLAEQTGLPSLISWADHAAPKPSAKLSALLELYTTHATAKKQHKRQVEKVWKDFIKITKAETLKDLTTEKLIIFRDDTKGRGLNADYVGAMYSKIKSVIRLGLKHGLDADDIRRALDRCNVLVVPAHKYADGDVQPNPIDKADYIALLAASAPEMRAVLLLALNCCMYVDEVLSVEWKQIDRNGVFRALRGKTKIYRMATLWPETLAAIQALSKRGESPYLFTSSHGTRFNSNSYRNKFNRLKESLGLKVEFNTIRDGAYTSAIEGQDNIGAVKLLAGHTFGGESDKYIQRRPQFVKPACDAVHAAYGPFPKSSGNGVPIGRPRKLIAI